MVHLTWADSSSVPSERVQSYDVVFKPYDSSMLSRISGWDGESDAIYSSVTVVVNSIASDSKKNGKKILKKIMMRITMMPVLQRMKIRRIMMKTRITRGK